MDNSNGNGNDAEGARAVDGMVPGEKNSCTRPDHFGHLGFEWSLEEIEHTAMQLTCMYPPLDQIDLAFDEYWAGLVPKAVSVLMARRLGVEEGLARYGLERRNAPNRVYGSSDPRAEADRLMCSPGLSFDQSMRIICGLVKPTQCHNAFRRFLETQIADMDGIEDDASPQSTLDRIKTSTQLYRAGAVVDDRAVDHATACVEHLRKMNRVPGPDVFRFKLRFKEIYPKIKKENKRNAQQKRGSKP